MSSLEKFKCGYCGWIIWRDENGQISHGCLEDCEELTMDKNRNLFRNDSSGTHLHVEVEDATGHSSASYIEGSTVRDKENIAAHVKEHPVYDAEKLDEDLISAVRERPALYDFRMPLKERGRKQKDYLWLDVSKCLKGLCSASEAEKRWAYLKDCYRKARNVYKKKQSTAQKSGAAGIPKNYEPKPSFRHYNMMTFLNDTLEYRQTVTSLQKSIHEEQASISNSTPSTSTSDNMRDDVFTPITNNSSASPSLVSRTSPKSRKRKRIDVNDYEEALINCLTQNVEPSPIDGFVSRLAEGLNRLSYKSRSKLEIEFLTRLYEIEEEDERYERSQM